MPMALVCRWLAHGLPAAQAIALEPSPHIQMYLPLLSLNPCPESENARCDRVNHAFL
jgi:hypothetical protein